MLETVVAETIAANSRVVGLLRTRSDPVYARKWDEFFNGYIFFHVTAKRYKLHVYAGLGNATREVVREEFTGSQQEMVKSGQLGAVPELVQQCA